MCGVGPRSVTGETTGDGEGEGDGATVCRTEACSEGTGEAVAAGDEDAVRAEDGAVGLDATLAVAGAAPLGDGVDADPHATAMTANVRSATTVDAVGTCRIIGEAAIVPATRRSSCGRALMDIHHLADIVGRQ